MVMGLRSLLGVPPKVPRQKGVRGLRMDAYFSPLHVASHTRWAQSGCLCVKMAACRTRRNASRLDDEVHMFSPLHFASATRWAQRGCLCVKMAAFRKEEMLVVWLKFIRAHPSKVCHLRQHSCSFEPRCPVDARKQWNEELACSVLDE